jgi:DNA-binding beta-propeller fold protein YncE
MIYQQNTLGADVAAFDEKRGYAETGRFKLTNGMAPDSVALSSDGSELYFNAHNRLEYWQDCTKSQRSAFYCLDAATMTEKWSIELPGQCEHFAISPDKQFVYNAHYDRKLVTRVDVRTREVTPIQIGNLGGHKVRVTKDGKKVYVGSIVWASLDEIDAEKCAVTRAMTFDQNVRPFDLSHDGARAYVQTSRFHGFHVVDLAAMRITRTVQMPDIEGLPTPCEDRYPFTIDHGIEITPDQKYLIALATTGHYVAVFSYPDLSFIKHIKVGREPSYLVVSKDSTLCYVSCRRSHETHIIDLSTLTVAHVMEKVGVYPQRLVLDH